MMLLVFDVMIVICLWCFTQFAFCDDIIPLDGSICWNKSCGLEFDPYSPLINCSYV